MSQGQMPLDDYGLESGEIFARTHAQITSLAYIAIGASFVWVVIILQVLLKSTPLPGFFKHLDLLILSLPFCSILLANRFRLPIEKNSIFLLLLAFSMMIPTISNYVSVVSIFKYLYSVMDIFILVVIFAFMRIIPPEKRTALLKLLIITIFFMMIASLISGFYAIAKGDYGPDVAVGYMAPGTTNTIGYIESLLLMYYYFSRQRFRIFFIFILIISMFVLEAKGAILTSLAAIIINTLIGNSGLIKKKLVSAIGMIVLLALILILISTLLTESVFDIYKAFDIVDAISHENELEGYTSASRVLYMTIAFNSILIDPHTSIFNTLFGFGPGSFISPAGYLFGNIFTYEIFYRVTSHGIGVIAHSQIGMLLYEFGVVGFVIFESFLIVLYWRLRKAGEESASAMVLIYFMAQPFLYIFSLKLAYYPFWIMIGIALFQPLHPRKQT